MPDRSQLIGPIIYCLHELCHGNILLHWTGMVNFHFPGSNLDECSNSFSCVSFHFCVCTAGGERFKECVCRHIHMYLLDINGCGQPC